MDDHDEHCGRKQVVNIRLACRRSFICNAGEAGRDAAFHFPNSYYKECSFNRLIAGSMGVLYQWLLLSYKSVCSNTTLQPSERNRVFLPFFFHSWLLVGTVGFLLCVLI